MRRPVIGLVVFAALIGVATAVLLIRNGSGDGEASVTTTPVLPGDLFSSNRTHLGLCVDRAGGGSVVPEEVSAVRDALKRALAQLHPVPPEFGDPTVDAACPPPITLSGQRLRSYDLESGLSKQLPDESLVSPYRLLVYFVPEDLYVSSFDTSRPFARAVAERVCHGDVCGEDTVAIYARQSITEVDLAEGLLKGLGLAPKTPEPTMDWAGCLQTTARPQCQRYLYCINATTEELQCKDFWEEMGTPPPPKSSN